LRRVVRVNTDISSYIIGLNNTYTQSEVQMVRDTIMSSLTKWNERMSRKIKSLEKKE
jgi:predicted transcriptional regulator